MVKKFISGLVLAALCVCLEISCTSPGEVQDVDAASGTRRQVELFPQRGHTFFVSSVAYSPEGKFIVSGSADSTIKIWDLETGREIWTLPDHDSTVKSVAYSPDGRFVASGSADYTIKIWDVENGQNIKTLSGHTSVVNSLAYSPDGQFLASGSTDRSVRIWDIESGRALRTLLGHSLWVNSVAYSPDGRTIASGSRDTTIKLWNTQTGRELRTLSGHTDEVDALQYSPDGKFIVSGSSDTTIKIWDAGNGREIRTSTGHAGVVRTVTYSPDGRFIASGSSVDSTIRIWDAGTGREIRSIRSAGIETLSYSPDGMYLASGSLDNSIRLWEAGTGREILTLAGRSSWIRAVAYSPDGKYIASGSTDRTVRIREAGTGRETRILPGHTASVRTVAYSPDGRYIVSGAADSSIRIWDAGNGREIQILLGHSSVVKSVVYSPDGRFIVSGSSDSTIKVWDSLTGKELRTLSGHSAAVNSLAFSPDGMYLVSGASDNTVKIWDMGNVRELRTLRGHASVVSVSYSPDGRYIAFGSMDGTISIRDAETGGEWQTLLDYSEHIKSGLAYSPNSGFLASAMEDNSIVIFDAESGGALRTLSGHTGKVYDLAYSPNGLYLVSASLDGTTRTWDTTTGREITQSIGFNNGEWISITPDGYYTASVRGDKYFNVRVGRDVYGLELYRPAFYKPSVVHARLQGRKIRNDRSIHNINTIGVPPTLSITGSAALSIHAVDQNFPLQSFRIYLNDRLIVAEQMAGLFGEGLKAAAFELPLTLDAGTNKISVVVSNGYTEGLASVTAEAPQDSGEGEALPNLRLLSIGISRYDEPRINHLGFAFFDAREMVNAFKAQEGKQYGTVTSALIATGELQAPTKNNITRELESFFEGVTSRDTVILFLSGHAVNDEDRNYYFLPQDIRINSDGTVPFSEALSWEVIASALDIPGRKLLFIDSSHSVGISAGNIRPVDASRLAMDLKPLRALLFTSSRGEELSLESAEYKLGLFTYAIVNGIGGEADSNKDALITMRELDSFVSQKVSDLSNGAQHPSAISLEDYADFNVAKTE
jgi:WD40 repeat protein